MCETFELGEVIRTRGGIVKLVGPYLKCLDTALKVACRGKGRVRRGAKGHGCWYVLPDAAATAESVFRRFYPTAREIDLAREALDNSPPAWATFFKVLPGCPDEVVEYLYRAKVEEAEAAGDTLAKLTAGLFYQNYLTDKHLNNNKTGVKSNDKEES